MNAKDVMNTADPAPGTGRAFYFAGWAVFVLSILLALSGGKTSQPHSLLPFWVTIAAQVAVSLAYFVGCLLSTRWRSKRTRRYFSPYLLGACGWLFFFLLFWILDHLAG